ncbi:MAG: hypothetical protein R2811_12020 [Flavobacteriales bacterium]
MAMVTSTVVSLTMLMADTVPTLMLKVAHVVATPQATHLLEGRVDGDVDELNSERLLPSR